MQHNPPIPKIDQLIKQRTDLMGILSRIEGDIARLKADDTSEWSKERQQRHAKSIAQAVGSKYKAQHGLAELKVEIKAENNRLHAAQQAAAHADRARREAEAKGGV